MSTADVVLALAALAVAIGCWDRHEVLLSRQKAAEEDNPMTRWLGYRRSS